MSTRTVARFVAAWTATFAVVHVAWALGWRAGVPADAAPIAERPWFLAYDVLAALLMFGAAVGAVTMADGHAPRWLRTTAVVAAVLALLRGLPALAIDVATARLSGVGFAADVWFTVAGGAGLLLVARQRTPVFIRPSSRAGVVPH